MRKLLKEISACRECASFLPHGCRPVVSVSPKSRIVIIGQAPGSKVHASGIPWDDKSGETLRKWMDISSEQFYNPDLIGIVPMGFCYPGKGKSGDLPPRKECAPLWHPAILGKLRKDHLVILIGQYSQGYYLKEHKKRTLTETVMHFEEYLPQHFVLPHPSPRNNIWMKKNPWFATDVLPALKSYVRKSLV